MNVIIKRGPTVRLDQIIAGKVFRFSNSYYMRCIYITENRERVYCAVDLYTGGIAKDIPGDTLVEIFEDAEVLLQ